MSPNLGDVLTPWLLKKLGKVDAAWVTPGTDYEHFIVTGSVLNWSSKHSVTWGAGLASWKDEVFHGADIRAFRGPLSLLRARSCGWRPGTLPFAVGDPGLLLPKLVIRSPKVADRVGIVPHYTDVARFVSAEDELASKGILLIDPFLPVEDFVAKLTSCERVMSSSLHGLIVADAYDVPNLWVRLGDGIGGDGMKFWDHKAAVGACLQTEPPTVVEMRHCQTSGVLEVAAAKDKYIAANQGVVREIQRKLIQTCPFIHASVYHEVIRK